MTARILLMGNTWLSAIVVSLALVLSACGRQSEAELLQQVKAEGPRDKNRALVLLRDGLQRYPNSAALRLEHGLLLLALEAHALAAVELQKARELGADHDVVVPRLCDAMLYAGEAQRVVEQFAKAKLGTPRANAEISTCLALAYGALGQPNASREAAAAAIALDAKYGPARVLDIRTQASNGDVAKARRLNDQLLQDEATNYEAWHLQGEFLRFVDKDTSAALQAYRKAIALNPKYVGAYVSALSTLISVNNIADAKALLSNLRQILPRHSHTVYFDTQIARLEGNAKRARELAQLLLKMAPQVPEYLHLAGDVEAAFGSPVIAESHLTKALQLAPEQTQTRKLLAATYLRLGYADKAMSTLKPSLDGTADDPELLGLAGQALLAGGQVSNAEEFLRRAAQARPDDSRLKTMMALLRVAKGNTTGGFEALEAIASKDDSHFADLALITARLRRGEHTQALAAIDAFEKKSPADATPKLMRAHALLSAGDAAGARASLEAVVRSNPKHLDAVTTLARLDVSEGRVDAARQRLKDLLKIDASNGDAILFLVDLELLSPERIDEALKLIDDAIRLRPADPAARVRRVMALLAKRDIKAALSAAQEANAALPDHAALLDALGLAQSTGGDYQQALSSYRRVASIQPGSPHPLVRMAEVYSAMKDVNSALQSYRRALEVAPASQAAQRGLVQLLVNEKRYGDALGVAKQMQRQPENVSLGHAFEGDILSDQGKWPAAASAYQAALSKSPASEQLAVKVHGALSRAGRSAEASAHASDWLRRFPSSALMLSRLAAEAIESRRLDEAERHLRRVIELEPSNAVATNNLAWLLVQQRKPGGLGLAERAVGLAPDRAEFMDTLASALSLDGQVAKALDVQRRAVESAPELAELRLNLATLYIKQGEAAKARTELEKLAYMGSKFPQQIEVARLLATLK